MPKDKDIEQIKDVDALELAHPTQLDLFKLLPDTYNPERFGQLFVFYHQVPKFTWGPIARKDGKYIEENIEREFVYTAEGKGIERTKTRYKLVVEPIRISGKDYLPGKQEEIVEAALIKLASRPEAPTGLFEGFVGLKFTLYQLQKELKAVGHSYNIPQIKKSLKILQRTTLTISPTGDKGENDYEFNDTILHSLYLNNRKSWQDGEKWCFVRFNMLISSSILKYRFRLYDHDVHMRLDKQLARYLHLRLAVYFTNADISRTYQPYLTTILEGAGKKIPKELAKVKQQMESALNELKENEILESWSMEAKREGRKIVDWRLTLTPSWNLISSIKAANSHAKKHQIHSLDSGGQDSE